MIRLDKYGPLWWRIAVGEFRAISRDYAVLLVLLGGIFAYGFLYNYMYAPNVVYDVPIAVVDRSRSAMSRQYIRWMDATPQVAVLYVASDMAEAKQRMIAAEIYGILSITTSAESSSILLV